MSQLIDILKDIVNNIQNNTTRIDKLTERVEALENHTLKILEIMAGK